jgi:hypothetical protein
VLSYKTLTSVLLITVPKTNPEAEKIPASATGSGVHYPVFPAPNPWPLTPLLLLHFLRTVEHFHRNLMTALSAADTIFVCRLYES